MRGLLVALLFLGAIQATAAPVRLTLVGELPFSPQELHEAMVARLPVGESGPELVVSGDGEAIGVMFGDRRRVVDIAGRTGPAAARVVALAVTDLVEETLPAVLPPPSARRRPFQASLTFGGGKGFGGATPATTSLELGLTVPFGDRFRATASLGWYHSFPERYLATEVGLDAVSVRLGAGVKLGPVETYVGPWLLGPYFLRGRYDRSGALAGGAVWSRLGIPIQRWLRVCVLAGLDVAAVTLTAIDPEDQTVVFSTPRAALWGQAGMMVDF